jgi:tetratricopeptide (TPR) repeat protein
MKKITLYLYGVWFGLTISGCATNENRSIVFPSDYQFIFTNRSAVLVADCEDELSFWKNRTIDETSLTKQAGLYGERFKLTGNFADLIKSDSLYKAALATYGRSPSLLQAMAASAITQHQFKPAKSYLNEAIKIGDQKDASLLMLVDVQLELGDHEGAVFNLSQLRNKNSFAFLIRLAKVKDHEGKLDTAIQLMEKAFERVKGNKNLFTWTKTNLGDMYGHAGRIEEAYQAYLEVLRQNPNDDYAIKGIAWIALSHDQNFEEAKRLIQYLQKNKDLPEYQLLLAEIADFTGDETGKRTALEKFNSLTADEATERMYAKYKAVLEAEEFSNPEKAIAIARQEIQSRPCPQSYDLLAWGYFSKGNYLYALEISQRYVEGKTFEPEALYHLGMIYGANKKVDKSRIFLAEALNSSFELGPSIAKKIKHELGR